MAKPFNPEDSSPLDKQPEPVQFGNAMKEILGLFHHAYIVQPLQDLCSRNEGVAMSVNSFNLKADDLSDAAYADL
ncbi:MAG TPA: hypothetical protein V6C76_01255 [Drouetiella sp.]